MVRLSRTDAASTSIERQREEIERWAAIARHDIVAWAQDEDVSGDVAPWRRPGLGQYLPDSLGYRDASAGDVARSTASSRAGEWDALVVWKLDRLSRRAADMLAVIDWCRANGRQVWETSGTEYTGPAGTLIVSVLGGLAQGERERMVERARSSFVKLSKSGRWRGGQVPWGYRVETDSAGHPRLWVDEEQAVVIRSVVARVLAGESINSIAADLNRRGVPTVSGRGEWRMGNLQRAVKSERLLGYMVREDKRAGEGRREYVVRGDDGMPVQRAEPILTRAELSAVRAKLADSRKGAGNTAGARPDRAMLLRVLWCWECQNEHEIDEPMYLSMGRSRRYYRCGSRSRTGAAQCSNGSIPAEAVEERVSALVLGMWGDAPVTERVWEAGTDATERIAELTEALRNLRDDRAAGLYSSPSAVDEYRATYGALEAQRTHLEALPQVPSGWRAVDTGRTLADRWQECATDAERNALLRSMGVRFYVDRGTGLPGQDAGARLRIGVPLVEDGWADGEARPVADLVLQGAGEIGRRAGEPR